MNWKSIKGYEGIYEVSDSGEIRSLTRKDRLGRTKEGKTKCACDNGTGYLVVNLKANGKSKMKTVHRLVAEAFIPNPLNLPEVNHKDGDKQNNRVENLEWCSHGENVKHAFNLGLNKSIKGSLNSNAKLTDDQVKFIRENHKPYDPEFGYEALARKFGCSATVIKHAAWGKSYVLVL
jgi:hypothetical protein